MRSAKATAETILRLYPDYGKAPPDYIVSMIQVIAAYPQSFHAAFADVKTGIPSRTKFLPTPYDFAEMAKELQAEADKQRAKAADDERWAKARLNASSEPYKPKQRERYYDTHGNEITAREAEERKQQHLRDMESMKRVSRTTAYVRHLGNGDALVGWQLMIERGLSEAPADWVQP